MSLHFSTFLWDFALTTQQFFNHESDLLPHLQKKKLHLYISIYLAIYLSIESYVYPSIYLSIYRPIYLSIYSGGIMGAIYPSIHLPILETSGSEPHIYLPVYSGSGFI
jgi:hypothetical protein